MKNRLPFVIAVFAMFCFVFQGNAQSISQSDITRYAKQQMNSLIGDFSPAAGFSSANPNSGLMEKILLETDDYMLTEILYQYWVDNAWMNDSKVLHYYDNNPYLIEQIMMVWIDGAWQNSFKYAFTNNASGEVLEMNGYMWNNVSSEWTLFMKMTYTYQNNLVSEVLMEMYMAGIWLPLSKFLFTYDGSGNMTEQLEMEWDNINSTWLNSSKDTWTYQNNNPVENITQEWESGAWVNEYKDSWTYNASGYYTEQLGMEWMSGAWQNYLKTTPTYNGSWQVTEELTEEWVSGAWSNWQLQQSTYNASGYLNLRIIQDWVNKGWENEEREERFYGTLGVGEFGFGNNELTEMKVTPNPFYDQAVVSFKLSTQCRVEVDIFDLSGRKIISLADDPFSAGVHSISWNGTDEKGNPQNSGLYFIRLKTRNFSAVLKTAIIR